MDEGDEVLALVHHIHLVFALRLIEQGLLDLQDQLRPVIDLLGVGDHFGAFLYIVLIVVEGTVAGVALDEHLKAVLDKSADRFRRCSYTSLVVHDFFGNTNDHIVSVLLCNFIKSDV